MSKKIIAIILAVAIGLACLCLAGCGAKQGAETTAPEESTSENAVPMRFVMGIDAEYPPFSEIGADGKYTGFDIDVCKAVCEYLGWEFDIFPVNWDNKLIQLDSHECDCVWSGMTILDSMKEAGYVISRPYFDNTQVILVKDGSDIASSADLAGKTVAVMLGTSGEKLLNEELQDLTASFKELTTCDNFLQCFTELDGNAVDAVIVDKPVAEKYASENKGFKVLDENLGEEQYGIAFRSGDEAICAQVESALDALVADGTYAKIAENYPDIQGNLIFLN